MYSPAVDVHAADVLAGMSDGDPVPSLVAGIASARNRHTSRSCWRHDATTVSTRSTNRLPPAESVPGGPPANRRRAAAPARPRCSSAPPLGPGRTSTGPARSPAPPGTPRAWSHTAPGPAPEDGGGLGPDPPEGPPEPAAGGCPVPHPVPSPGHPAGQEPQLLADGRPAVPVGVRGGAGWACGGSDDGGFEGSVGFRPSRASRAASRASRCRMCACTAGGEEASTSEGSGEGVVPTDGIRGRPGTGYPREHLPGRERTDGGVRHKTSGVWHQVTVTGIARNPLLRRSWSTGDGRWGTCCGSRSSSRGN